ncbi:hypothetical protein GCWU000246_00375 [Jonquetella anthropi E3_33 E1]|nr:hypothetical protein GCWU000246_00375 [Jonquetella anthropi E3_33 E1]
MRFISSLVVCQAAFGARVVIAPPGAAWRSNPGEESAFKRNRLYLTTGRRAFCRQGRRVEEALFSASDAG